jgi:photosystem II stability/assembly factor-like uncharacterized protein
MKPFKILKLLFLSVLLIFTRCTLMNDSNVENLLIEKLYPSEDHFLLKQYPEKKFNIDAYDKSLNAVKEFDNRNGTQRNTGVWQVQGPGNIGARANCIAIHPFNDKIMLIGFSEGGLFRTEDGGTTWTPVFDDKIRLSIGDIAFDPKNGNIVYAATGDPNVSGFPFIGDGIYKSLDSGKTWTNIGLNETRVLSHVKISNQNSDVIYASSMGIPFEKSIHRGVFKTIDGGKSWSQVLFINDSTGVADLVVHPNNHNIVFATGWNRVRNNYKSLVAGPDAKIFKSIDGGITWSILGNGLPEDRSSRIGIDISKSNPNVLYACYTDAGDFNLRGVYKSVDGGENWNALDIGNAVGLERGIYGGFGWYFGKIRINPVDENDVFILGVDMYRSKNGGLNWTLSVPPWWTYEVHADKHDLIFDNETMYLTTDGGAYKANVSDEDWQDIENIPTTQFYRVGYNPHKADFYYGGAQDNGTSGGNATMINEWERIYGGDGFQPIFHPFDPDIFYVETQNGGLAVTSDGGENFVNAGIGISQSDPRNWDMPIMMSHHDPDVLYTGTNKIYINESGAAVSWKAISPDLTDPSSPFLRHNISTLHESPINPNYIAAGTSDGLLWVTKDKGQNWLNISGGLPSRYISSVIFSTENENTLYVSYTGYRDNDNTPYIFESKNLGTTWSSIQGDMPNIAINNILMLPSDRVSPTGVLVIATDAGVYISRNNGRNWTRMGNNMPYVTVYDVEFNPSLNQIIAGTFGRSIQSFDLNQINYPTILSTNVTQKLDFKVYPSTVFQDHNITIAHNAGNMVFEIFNANGKVVNMHIPTTTNITKVNVGSLPIGLYFVKPKNLNAKAIRFVKI